MKRTMVHLLVVFACAAFSFSAGAQLSVIQQPGTVVGSFSGTDQSVGATTVTLYTVPAGRFARLTDLIVSSRHTTGLCYFTIASQSALLSYEIVVPPQSTLHLPFNNGPAFGPEQQIQMSRSNRIAAQCNDYLFFTARGYLFTVP